MITLLHPSRGRPQMAYNTFKYWQVRAVGEFEYILGIDESDPQRAKYKELFQNEGILIHVGNNSNLVECTNKIAKLSKGDILVYLSDDFECPLYWDIKIEQYTKGHDKFMLKVDDCLQPFEQTVLTIPIMSRSLYNELGYFWYHEYSSMWCDVDLYMNTKKYMIHGSDLLFKHNHYLTGAKMDATYKNSEANFNSGKAIFARRDKEFNWGFKFD